MRKKTKRREELGRHDESVATQTGTGTGTDLETYKQEEAEPGKIGREGSIRLGCP